MTGDAEAKAQWAERVLGVRIPRAPPVVGAQRLAQQPAAPRRPGAMPPLPAAPSAMPPLPAVPTPPPSRPAAPAPFGGATPLKVPANMPAVPDTPIVKQYKAAYDKIKGAVTVIDYANPGSEAAKLGVAFKALPMPPDPATVVDFAQALADAQPRLALAPTIDEAANYDFVESHVMPPIRKAGVYTKQSGAMKGNEKANNEVVALVTNAAAALKKQDYKTAETLLSDAGKRAREVNQPYETLVKIEQNKPLFARVEKLLGQKKLSPDLRQGKDEYSQLSKNLTAALKTTDYKAWESDFEAKRKLATRILKSSQQQQVADWFDTQQARPAERAVAGGGIATGLATMPDLSAMSEADKSAAMCKQIGWAPDDLKTQATDVYAKALLEGQKLDLTPAQIAAAAGYSGAAYSDMNGLLRGSLDTTQRTPEQVDLLKVHIELLCQALDKLPDYDAAGFPLFRWETPYGDYLQSRYQVDSPVFEIKEFWSTGAGGGSAVGASPTAEILVWGKKKSKAKSISMLSKIAGEGARSDKAQLKGQGAGEVLFAPGTRFKTRFFKAFDRNNKEVLQRIDAKDNRVTDFHYRIEIEEV